MDELTPCHRHVPGKLQGLSGCICAARHPLPGSPRLVVLKRFQRQFCLPLSPNGPSQLKVKQPYESKQASFLLPAQPPIFSQHILDLESKLETGILNTSTICHKAVATDLHILYCHNSGNECLSF